MNKQQLKESNKIWKIISFFLFLVLLEFIIGFLYSVSHGYDREYEQGFKDGQANATLNNGINMLNFTDTLELINNNCGSVFFTKNYGQTEFSIFAQKCLGDGFCKPVYKTIEECLK